AGDLLGGLREGRRQGRNDRRGRVFSRGTQAFDKLALDFGPGIGLKRSSAQITRGLRPGLLLRQTRLTPIRPRLRL
ncbi:MAG: Protein secretion chaperonin CsaA, partial [uncultured Rubrobacteraceae bacterium]